MSDYSKKRELMPKLNAVIAACVEMSHDTAKLEMSDNSQASKRLKQSITDMTNGPLAEFKEAIHAARHEIITSPRKRTDGRAMNGAHLRKNTFQDPEKNEDF